jgi:hypothetical protein
MGQIVLEMGYVWTPANLDAGIDGTIEIRDPKTEAALNLILRVQSKATEGRFINETDHSFEYIVNERDLNYWLQGNCPVILVRSNVMERKAYWVSIKDYFADTSRRKVRKIVFDKAKDLFSPACADRLLSLAAPKGGGSILAHRRFRRQFILIS